MNDNKFDFGTMRHNAGSMEPMQAICNLHRTEQANVARNMIYAIRALAELGDNGDYDARNEDAVKWAQSVMTLVPRAYIRYI